uniref:Uncharacterized protein n=1 Tax=Globodera rostochiensis TaxID=31243 RepID=A0A914HVR8_GLORO
MRWRAFAKCVEKTVRRLQLERKDKNRRNPSTETSSCLLANVLEWAGRVWSLLNWDGRGGRPPTASMR